MELHIRGNYNNKNHTNEYTEESCFNDLFKLDSNLDPSHPDFYTLFSRKNKNQQKACLALQKLEHLFPCERALLPLFRGASEAYTQLIISSLSEKAHFNQSDRKGKFLVNLIQSSKLEFLPLVTKNYFLNMVSELNELDSFFDVDLSGLVLSGLALSGLNLSHADLSYATAEGAILINTNLSHAKLSYANLCSANVTEANLANAELYKTNLVDAILLNARLDEKNLVNAYIKSSKLNDETLTDAFRNPFHSIELTAHHFSQSRFHVLI